MVIKTKLRAVIETKNAACAWPTVIDFFVDSIAALAQGHYRRYAFSWSFREGPFFF